MSRVLRVAACLIALSFAFGQLAVAFADEPSVDEVAKHLMCQCGCGMTVAECASSMECMFSDQTRDVIGQQIAEGKSQGEIINYFVSIYGERILSAPTKSGLNLAAWVAPFVAVIGGAALVGRLIFVWRRRTEEHGEAESPPPDEEELERYEQLVELELKEY